MLWAIPDVMLVMLVLTGSKATLFTAVLMVLLAGMVSFALRLSVRLLEGLKFAPLLSSNGLFR